MTHGNSESSTRDLSLRTGNRFPSQSNDSIGPPTRETKEASVQRSVETNGLALPEYQTSPCAKPERSSFTFRQRNPPNTTRSVETDASPSKKKPQRPDLSADTSISVTKTPR
ncbi:hypothetical protein F2Q69_00012182 [Brassica cretica]|uniref:Uncharacterized protein n=1 Tax=Brassica cretica TaxID=69181 RepID=A0A8S9R8C2_BRACR|nr:hypothetical protein F2Q69_00012182 [Brassica cretica]